MNSEEPGGLHPATELVLLGCGLVLIYGVGSPLVPAAILLCVAVAAAWSRRIQFNRWLMTLIALAGPMLVMVGIIQGLFYPGRDAEILWQAGPAAVTVEGLSVALQLWLRVAAMIAVCALFAFGSDAARMFDGLIRLHAPVSLAYVCAAAMSLVPVLQNQTRQTVDARAARGWNTSRWRTRVALTPRIAAGLVTSSLIQFDQRHQTLIQRGFDIRRRPSPLQDHDDGSGQRTLRRAAPLCVLALVVASLSGVLALPTASELLGWLRG